MNTAVSKYISCRLKNHVGAGCRRVLKFLFWNVTWRCEWKISPHSTPKLHGSLHKDIERRRTHLRAKHSNQLIFDRSKDQDMYKTSSWFKCKPKKSLVSEEKKSGEKFMPRPGPQKENLFRRLVDFNVPSVHTPDMDLTQRYQHCE